MYENDEFLRHAINLIFTQFSNVRDSFIFKVSCILIDDLCPFFNLHFVHFSNSHRSSSILQILIDLTLRQFLSILQIRIDLWPSFVDFRLYSEFLSIFDHPSSIFVYSPNLFILQILIDLCPSFTFLSIFVHSSIGEMAEIVDLLSSINRLVCWWSHL